MFEMYHETLLVGTQPWNEQTLTQASQAVHTGVVKQVELLG